jgi:hypothetical protein
MNPEPKLDRYKRPELQETYESGFAQEYDHDLHVARSLQPPPRRGTQQCRGR